MDTSVSRRAFLKSAGTAAGVAIAAGYSPFSYAQNDKVRVAAIGTGGQGSLHLRYGLADAKDIELVAVCDVYKPHLDGGWDQAVGKDEEKKKNVKKYMDYHEMLDKEKIDAVVIATPLYTHHKIAMDCLDAGKYVFCEKTMCYTIEQCQDLVKKCHEKNLFVQVGHQRHYNLGYNRAIAMARQGNIGRINYVTAQWHRNNDWRRPVDSKYVLSDEEKKWIQVPLERWLNWRLYREYSAGGLMTELAAHQLDMCNWFFHGLPKRVVGFGGIDYWKDGRDVEDNVLLAYEYDMSPSNPAFGRMDKRSAYQDFGKINQRYTVRVEFSSICANAKRTYGEQFHGDKGTIETVEEMKFIRHIEDAGRKPFDSGGIVDASAAAKDITSGKTREAPPVTDDGKEEIKVPQVKGADGKPFDHRRASETLQFEAFARDIKAKKTPKCNQVTGLYSAIAALSGAKALVDKTVVEIDPKWSTFDFEAPDPFAFDDPGAPA